MIRSLVSAGDGDRDAHAHATYPGVSRYDLLSAVCATISGLLDGEPATED